MGYTEEGIGYQSRDTSLAAAEANTGKKVSLREQVYKLLLQSAIPLSADQIADQLGRSFISIRPRVTELSNDLRVEDSGKRGKTQWGKSCILWQVRGQNEPREG